MDLINITIDPRKLIERNGGYLRCIYCGNRGYLPPGFRNYDMGTTYGEKPPCEGGLVHTRGCALNDVLRTHIGGGI